VVNSWPYHEQVKQQQLLEHYTQEFHAEPWMQEEAEFALEPYKTFEAPLIMNVRGYDGRVDQLTVLQHLIKQ
jgi:hypothetical protein